MDVTEVDPLAALKQYKSQFDTDGDCASALSVSKQYLHQMLIQSRPVSPRVLAKLGLKKVIVNAEDGVILHPRKEGQQ